jgi:hypothetical protein
VTVTTLNPRTGEDALIDAVRPVAAALAECLDAGNGGDAEAVAAILGPLGLTPVQAALVLLLADCASKTRIQAVCAMNPGLAAANAKRAEEAEHRAAEYAWLRDGGVCPDEAARRCGIRGKPRQGEYESAYQAARERTAAA